MKPENTKTISLPQIIPTGYGDAAALSLKIPSKLWFLFFHCNK
jgi:hypothetical protein